MSEMGRKAAKQVSHLPETERMELTNISIEMHALCRIFDHAACDSSGTHEEAKRVYRDVSALLRPVCARLDRLREAVAGH